MDKHENIKMHTFALNEFDDLNGSFGDVGHVLSMRELTKEGRSPDDDINAINTYVEKEEED